MGDDEDLAERVAALEREVRELRERLSEHEATMAEREGPSPDASDRDAGADPAGAVDGPATGDDRTATDRARPGPDPVEVGATPDEDDTAGASRSAVERSRDLSVTVLLGVAGVFALVVMVGFATQYVIQEELIGRFGQVLAGTALGLLLWAGGVATARRTAYDTWGWTVAGGGVAVTYYAVYASYGFESYREAIDPPLVGVFLVLGAVVAVAVATSVWERRQVLAGESLLLGFVTVWFVRDLTLAGLGYGFLLTLGIAVVVLYRDWVWLTVPAVLGSYGAAVAVLVAGVPETTVVGTVFVGYCVAVLVVYLGTVLAATTTPVVAEVTTTANAVGFCLLGFAGVAVFFENAWDPVPPLVASLGLGAVLGLLERGRTNPDLLAPALDLGPDAWNGFRLAPAVFVLTTTVGVGLQSLFWSGVVAVAAVPAGTTLASRRARWVYGPTVPVGLALWSLLVPLHALEYGGIEALAAPAVTYTLVAGAVAAATAWWVADHDALTVRDWPVGTAYAWLFAGLVFLTPVVDLSGVGLSLAWTLIGFGLLAGGIGLGRVELRRSSFVVFGLTYLKVFFFDTTGLALPQRILSLFVLGVVLLVASLAYRRYLGGLAADAESPQRGDPGGEPPESDSGGEDPGADGGVD